MWAFAKKTLALLLAAALCLGLVPAVAAAAPEHLIVNQVYGGSDDGQASHSFIELYNPTAETVDLSAWSVQYRSSADGAHADRWYVCGLTGEIAPGGYYLIRCGATTGTAFAVPAGNVEWDIQLHNKGLAVALVSRQTQLPTDFSGDVTDQMAGNGVIDLAAAAGNDHKPSKGDDKADTTQLPPAWEGAGFVNTDGLQSKKKAIRRVEFIDTDQSAADFVAVDYSEDVGAELQPHGTAPVQPVYTPVTTSDEKIQGYANAAGTLNLVLAARYNSGAMNADGTSLEIVDYNSANGFAYAVSGLKGKLIAIPVSGTPSDKVVALDGTEIDIRALVSREGFTYGDMTSVAVSPDGTEVAVAIQEADYTKAGLAAVFDIDASGLLSGSPVLYTVGVQPDMLTYTPDGTRLLTANEGEPRQGYGAGTTDPVGSISIIDLTALDVSAAVATVGFDAFDDQVDALTAENVILGIVDGVTRLPSVDLEPEYIACTDATAYVSLQEANAIAVLDIPSGSFTDICSAGYQDYSAVPVDFVEDGQYQAKTYEGLVGARMPDGISLVTVAGVDYVLAANEGDTREWGEYANEVKTKAFTGKNIRVLDADCCAGLPAGKTVAFGGRGFTIYRADSSGLAEVFDSGSDFEALTAKYIPDYFNVSNDDVVFDSRSAKKGPEPESVTVGAVNDRIYAFIALERVGGIMAYDITDPTSPHFENYVNSRSFASAIEGDVSPEGLCFTATGSSAAMLLAACEVSGTLAVYEMEYVPETFYPPYTPATPTESTREDGEGDTEGSQTEPPSDGPTFDDVPGDSWYAGAVGEIAGLGLMHGVSDTEFAPTQPMSRVMVWAVLARLHGEKIDGADWAVRAGTWAKESGISDGSAPTDAVSREQLVTMLWRAAGAPAVQADLSGFSDAAAISGYASDAMRWAVSAGLIQGTDTGRIDPDGSATRAQVAVFLIRYCRLLAHN